MIISIKHFQMKRKLDDNFKMTNPKHSKSKIWSIWVRGNLFSFWTWDTSYLNRIIDFLHFGNLDIGLVELYGKHFGQTTFIQEKTFGMANLVWRCFMQISFWIWRVLWNSIQQSDISRISRGTGLSLSYWICPMIVFIEKSNHSLKEIAPGGKMLKRMCYCYSFQFWRNINWCLIINHRRRWWMFLWIVPSPFSSIAANMFLRSSSPSAGRLRPSLQ